MDAKRWLFREYWRVFGPHYVPLAIGIHRKIIANSRHKGTGISGNAIRRAIYARTNYDKYLMAMIERDESGAQIAMRHDLRGRPVEPVSQEDIKAALKVWRERRKLRQARSQPLARSMAG